MSNSDDLEAEGRGSGSTNSDDRENDNPFDIQSTKEVSIERLRRWRQSALVLNASRRFRYTMDLKKEEEKQQILRKIRAHAQAIRSAQLFKEAGAGELKKFQPTPDGDFGISEKQLSMITRDHNFDALQEIGGVNGLSDLLKTNIEKGISGADVDLQKRRNEFGANTYPQPKGRSFWRILWEACQDYTLIILIVAAVISLVLGIRNEGIKRGWYDGAGISFAVVIVIVVTGGCKSKVRIRFNM